MEDEAIQYTPSPPVVDKLFVYGSLNSPYNLQLLTGQTLKTEQAVLYGHRRIHPKSGYPFAIPWSGSKIEGSLAYDITPEILEKLDEYESEGNLYTRQQVTVHIGEQPVEAYVYIGIPEALEPYFRKGIGKRDRIEEFIEKRINHLLEDKAARYLKYDHDHELPVQVIRELLSEETHSLVREYFRESGMPVFILKHELEDADIPSLEWIRYDPNATQYADEYIQLAVKFMIFNQLEERFRHEFRPRVKVSDEYYRHTISAMMALKLLVSHYQHLKSAMFQLSADRYDPSFSYIDYAVAAIYIAKELYTTDRAKEVVDWVREHRHIGRVPLGAELEFSPIGGRAVTAQEGDEPRFDGFYYFYDFDLMRRGWKLGAHIDDHGFLTTTHTRTRGFLELAFGRYKLLGDVSKPATRDPWVLAQLIDLAIRYMEIRPHSLHISLQTEKNVPFQKIETPEYLLCLLLLGGDLRLDDEGILREMRIYQHDIIREGNNVHFSRFNRHHKDPEDMSWSFVVEYQFPRLLFDYDYQPLIMALKGLQLAANPYPLKNVQDCPYEDLHREIETFLIQWATHPTPISAHTLEAFLAVIEHGLDKEAAVVGSKQWRYAQRILGRIEEQLKRRNQRIQTYHAYS
ncbi:hypothetical protein GF339_08780 [candidate division KSB3 bacterium]|uniref:Putative gamma-glutamylcyclotransferase n=1 Tax=candidate division KSB3 bacterium TaxID=2044937 RepID=A0A9D5JV02_9BACT|nr:hypothetical protein [candidate division KSB3 bacterium]MBD3324665.1 hypothetical protein [candidate division KSB3 bacterium]